MLRQADVELWTETTIKLQTFEVPVRAWSEDTQLIMPVGLLKENWGFTRVELQEVSNEKKCGNIYFLE